MSPVDEIPVVTQLLTGQVALVTGGGRGLGRAYALALAKAGAAVAVAARTASEIQAVQREIEQHGGYALAMPTDVTDAKAVGQLVTTVEQQLGPVSLLINNAGVINAVGRISEVEADVWWHDMAINVLGPFLCSQAVLPGMLARKRGRIINVASRAGLWAVDGGSAYSLSKTALIRLTEQLALEVKDQGIAVFAIHPGTVRTPLTDFLHDAAIVGQRTPWVQQSYRRLYAGQTDTPIEQSIALILALASGQGDSLSGRFISVEDDLKTLLQQIDAIKQLDQLTLRLRQLQED